MAAFANARYEEALSWARTTAAANRDWVSAWRVVAQSAAFLDLIEEARSAVRQILRLDPTMTITKMKAGSVVRGDHFEWGMDALRRAGLPEE